MVTIAGPFSGGPVEYAHHDFAEVARDDGAKLFESQLAHIDVLLIQQQL